MNDKNGFLSCGVLLWCFLLIPAFAIPWPDDSIIGLVLMGFELFSFIAWIIYSAVSVLKEMSLSEIWEGFLDYIIETWQILKYYAIFLIVLLLIVSGIAYNNLK